MTTIKVNKGSNNKVSHQSELNRSNSRLSNIMSMQFVQTGQNDNVA